MKKKKTLLIITLLLIMLPFQAFAYSGSNYYLDDTSNFTATTDAANGGNVPTNKDYMFDNNLSTYATFGSNRSIKINFSQVQKVEKIYIKLDDNIASQSFTVALHSATGAKLFTQTLPSGLKGEQTITLTNSIDNVSYVVIGGVSTASVYLVEFDIVTPLSVVATTIGTLSIVGGSYELNTPANIDFGTISLSSDTQTISKPLGIITVGDLTGSSQGWRLQVQATNFQNSTDAFNNNNLLLKAPSSVSATNGTISTGPSIVTGYPWFIDVGSSVTVLSAAVGQGMGTYSADFSTSDALTLSIPPSSKTGNYNTTISWKIVVGP